MCVLIGLTGALILSLIRARTIASFEFPRLAFLRSAVRQLSAPHTICAALCASAACISNLHALIVLSPELNVMSFYGGQDLPFGLVFEKILSFSEDDDEVHLISKANI